MLNTRRESILETLVEEYIRLSRPISSEFLAKSGHFNFSSATMRNEFAQLTQEGYTEQPHTSAGRIPTNKGYRYYVDELMGHEELDRNTERTLGKIFQDHSRNMHSLHSALTHYIASVTGNLVFSELLETAQSLTFGFEQLVKQPEFEDPKVFRQLARVIDRLEEDWQDIVDICDEEAAEQVFIGTEHALFEKNISSVAGKYPLRSDRTLFMTVIGPNRMNYGLTLGMLGKISEFLNDEHGTAKR